MARTLNVSKGGVLIETHHRLFKGQQVMITLGLQDQLIDVMGRVVYVVGTARRFHGGIEFFHLSDTDKKVLDRYVNAFHAFYAEESKNPLEHDGKGDSDA